jgi:hypothetical protein
MICSIVLSVVQPASFSFFLAYQGQESLLFDDLGCNKVPLLKM